MSASTSMDESSEGHSTEAEGQSRAGKKRKVPRKELQHIFHRGGIDHGKQLGRFILEMPSALKDPGNKLNIAHCPSLFFDVVDDDQREGFEIMKKLSHPNILEVYLIDDAVGEGCRVYVEEYLGKVSDILHIIPLVDPKTGIVPSVQLKDLVSDAVDGLKYLMENDKYHGNFAWETTFYCNDNTRTTLKLANFERRRTESPQLDCVSLGYALAEISERVKQTNPPSTCCLLDDLSRRLISVTPQTFKAVMRDIKKTVFFWDERRRKSFYAVEVSANLDNAAFVESFMQSESRPTMPWTDKKYMGFMDAMEAYQVQNEIDKYDGQVLKHFLQCMSGMYTHQTELVVETYVAPVDTAVHHAHPRLCLDLKIAVDQANAPAVNLPDPAAVNQPDPAAVNQPDPAAVNQPNLPDANQP